MDAAREVYCLVNGNTGLVTDGLVLGVGPKPQQFGTTYINKGTSSRSMSNSESTLYRHKDW